jgi:hypothetical protein
MPLQLCLERSRYFTTLWQGNKLAKVLVYLRNRLSALVRRVSAPSPLFSFSGDWQRLVVLASAGPFLASLASLNSKDGTK